VRKILKEREKQVMERSQHLRRKIQSLEERAWWEVDVAKDQILLEFVIKKLIKIEIERNMSIDLIDMIAVKLSCKF